MKTQFVPTWLYVKQHNDTGLKYFGKTNRDPNTYKGSGTYWRRHLKKHGNNVTTMWSKLFTNRDELIEFALNFSKAENIVESDEWANIIPENGIDGNVTGYVLPALTKQKLLEANAGIPKSTEHKAKLSAIGKERVASEETRAKMSASASKPKSEKWKLAASANRTGKPANNKGVPHSAETKLKMASASTGENNGMFGRSHSDEAKRLMAEARKGKAPGNKGVKMSEEQKLARRLKMDERKRGL
jgi:hypothetical protein